MSCVSDAILQRVENALRDGPLTMEEIAKVAGLTVNDASATLWEFYVELGIVERVGEKFWWKGEQE